MTGEPGTGTPNDRRELHLRGDQYAAAQAAAVSGDAAAARQILLQAVSDGLARQVHREAT
jgi:hypothetical protein